MEPGGLIKMKFDFERIKATINEITEDIQTDPKKFEQKRKAGEYLGS